jgi:hypothetical protein
MGLGLLVLLATAVVTGVAPGTPGNNAFGVDIADARPGAGQTAGQVLLRLSMPEDEAMGVTEVSTTTHDGQRYTAAGSYLSMAGRRHVEVILRRAGFDDVRQAFDASTEP